MDARMAYHHPKQASGIEVIAPIAERPTANPVFNHPDAENLLG